MPEVSVIIPVYNGRRFITEAVESVLRQTWKDLEIVVVDDGSTDDVKAVLQPYIDARKIRYFYQRNSGPAKARNTGIVVSRGTFIAFLDSDDLWAPDKTERQMQLFKSDPLLCAVHTDLEFVKDGRVLRDALDRRHFIRSGNIFEHCLLLRCIVFLSTLMVRRSVLDEVGLFNETLHTAEDTNLTLRIARQHPFGFVDSPLVFRRIHESNITVVGTRNYGTFRNLDHISRLYPELDLARSRVMRAAYERRYLLAGCSNFRSGHYVAARPFLLKAMKIRPFNAKTIVYFLMTLFPGSVLDGLRKMKGQLFRYLKGGVIGYQEQLW